MSKSFRGFIQRSNPLVNSPEPRATDTTMSVKTVEVPSSFEYTLEALIASGSPLSNVNTEVLHDASAVDALVNNPDVSPSKE